MPESFFVEPFTGIAHPLTSENYLGIESLWNHQNYWVNMQDCSAGVKVYFSYSHKHKEQDVALLDISYIDHIHPISCFYWFHIENAV